MKPTAAILLLVLLAFNWVGYRLISVVVEQQADQVLENRIENNSYDESLLVEIRVPLNAPYLAGQSTDEYERHYGEIEIAGIHYKYVKRKMTNGELVLLCLPNEDKTAMQNKRVDFFRLVNDLTDSPQSKKNNSSSINKGITSDYQQEMNSWVIEPCPAFKMQFAIADDRFRSSGYRSIPGHPPQG